MSETLAPLSCPKCGGAMRAYERSGVTVDQCSECRGVYLDRGELERLIDAEQAHYAAPPRYEQPRPDRPAYDSDHGYGRKKRKRESFLSELFD